MSLIGFHQTTFNNKIKETMKKLYMYGICYKIGLYFLIIYLAIIAVIGGYMTQNLKVRNNTKHKWHMNLQN